MHRYKKIKLSKFFIAFVWLVVITGGYFILHGKGFDRGAAWGKMDRLAYEMLHRPLWAVCICWVIWACYHGYGGIINKFLSFKYFVVISKLGYGVYMLHWVVLTFIYLTIRYKKSFTHLSAVSF